MQVASDPRVGDRDEAEPRILYLALQRLGHHDPNAVGQFACASRGRSSLILFTNEPLPGRQHLNLRPAGNKPLARLEHLNTMRGLGRNHSNADQRPPVQLKMPSLRHRRPQTSSERQQRSAARLPLLLQRMHVAKQQVELKNPSEHALCRPFSDRRAAACRPR